MVLNFTKRVAVYSAAGYISFRAYH
jgi:hypothetical protein